MVTVNLAPVARLSPIEQPKKPVRSLAAFRATVPRWGTSSAKLLRQMRDEQH